MSEEAKESVNLEEGAAKPADAETAPPKSQLPKSAPPVRPSNLKAPSKIGRLCMTHDAVPKAGPPPLEQKNGTDANFLTMRRSSNDGQRSPLSDVNEETERELVRERYSTRSSISPEGLLFSKPPKGDRKTSNGKAAGINPDKWTSVKKCMFGSCALGTKTYAHWLHYGSMGGDLYWEATGRRRSSDHGVILTADTDSFIIGQRVWVGGIRPGHIAYIGETHFAPGDWAGIVLDEPSGKNDGCVSGKRYFQCEPKKGIFSRLTRLTHEPLNIDVSQKDKEPTPPGVTRSIISPARAFSPTSSLRSSSILKSPGKQGIAVGDRVIVSSGLGSRAGILKYMGETKFAQGNWCGVQLDEPTGKNDGSVDGVNYFECPPKYGIFVPISKVSLSPSSRKSRMSRAGSRESLTSVGTMNSIATTNTSRLRMSAQKLTSSAPKPVSSTPKLTFSLQDVIREKQNHIEQLMIERELDREDAQNQAMMYQKSINELKGRIHNLEKLLEDERKKSEDLQFSNDEATFCRDELNAQSQVFKERIAELEQQALQQSVTDGKAPDISIYDGQINSIREENRKLMNEIENLNLKMKENNMNYEKRLLDIGESEETLKTEVESLLAQNEDLKNELRSKDESYEKLYLEAKELQDLYKEETNTLRESIKQKENEVNELKSICVSKESVVSQITSDITETRKNLEQFEKIKKDLEAECQKLRNECSQHKDKFAQNTKEIESLRNEVHREKEASKQLEDKLKLFEDQNADTKKITDEYNAEVSKLKKTVEDNLLEIAELKKDVEEHESGQAVLSNELMNLKTQNSDLVESKNALEIEIASKVRSIEKGQKDLNELKKQIEDLSAKLKETEDNTGKLIELGNKDKLENEQLKKSLEKLEREVAELRQHVENKHKEYQELSQENEVLKNKLLDLEKLKNSLDGDISSKVLEINNNKNLIENMNVQISTLNLKQQELEKKNNELVDENNRNLAKLVEYENLLKSLEGDKASIATETSKVNQQLAEKEAELVKVNGQLENLKKALENSQREYEDFKQTNEGERNKLTAEIENNKTQLTNKIQEYGANKNSLEEEINNLKQLYNETKKQMEDKEKEFVLYQENTEKERKEMVDITNKTKTELESLNNECKNAQTIQETTQKLLNELELKHGDMCRRYEALEQKCQEVTSQKENLQQELSALRSSSTDINAEITRLASELAAKQKSYEELLDSTNNNRIQLENKVEEMGRDISLKVEEIKKLQTEMLKLQDEKKMLAEEIEKIKQNAKDEQNAEVTRIKGEFESRKAAMEAILNEKSEQLGLFQILLDKSLDSLQQQIKNLQEELDKSQKMSREREEDLLNQVGKYCNNQKALWLDLQSKQKSLPSITMSDELMSFQISMSDLLSSLDTNSKLLVPETRIDSLQLECSSLKSSIDTTINQNNEFLGQIENLCQLLQEMENERAILISQNNELQEKLAAYEKEKNDAFNNLEMFAMEKEGAVKKLMEKIEQVEKENIALLEKITNNENSMKQLHETVEKSTDYANNLQKDLEGKVKEIAEKLSVIAELNHKLEASEKDLVEKDKQTLQIVAELNKKIEEQNSISNDRANENANLNLQLTEVREKLEILEKEKREACNNLEMFSLETENMMQSLSEQIKEKDTEKANLLKSIASESSSIKALQKELEASKKISDDLRIEVEVRAKDLASQVSLIAELNSKVENLQKDIVAKDKNAEELSNELNKKIEGLTSASEESKIQNEILKAEIQKLEENLNNIEREKNDACNNLELLSLETEKIMNELEDKLKLVENERTDMIKKASDSEASLKEIQKEAEILKRSGEELQKQLQIKETELKEKQTFVDELRKNVEASQNSLVEKQKQSEGMATDLNKKLEELMITLNAKSEENTKLQQQVSDFEQKIQLLSTSQTDALSFESKKLSVLTEQYSNLTNEHNACQAAMKELRKNVEQHKNYVKQIEEKLLSSDKEKNALLEAQSKWEKDQLVNQRNMRELQLKLELAEKNRSVVDLGQLASSQNGDENQSEAQVNFLNSIIADMQKKNEKLTARIEALEAGPADFENSFGFDLVKRKPAPRLFCDICDVFDAHETEDCPLQCSDSPPMSLVNEKEGGKKKAPPPPRKYCETCEVFGHEAGECPDDETY